MPDQKISYETGIKAMAHSHQLRHQVTALWTAYFKPPDSRKTTEQAH